MQETLHWNTVTPLLRAGLQQLMGASVFDPFLLVGGTSLSLQLGHRFSVDIDLFTDAEYESIDFKKIDAYLRSSFPYVSPDLPYVIALGVSYIVGEAPDNAFKLDIYYTDSFIRAENVIEGIRLANIEDVIAMKIDVVQHGGRKKDFWDIHELLDKYNIQQMISLHEERYPYGHDEQLIRENLKDFSAADNDFDPECLRGKYWELIKLDILESQD